MNVITKISSELPVLETLEFLSNAYKAWESRNFPPNIVLATKETDESGRTVNKIKVAIHTKYNCNLEKVMELIVKSEDKQ